MKIIFSDKTIQYVFESGSSKVYPSSIIRSVIKKIYLLQSIESTQDLYSLKSLHYEKLINYPKGSHSIRVNDSWRIIFDIIQGEIHIIDIKELSNHYA